MDMFVDLLAAFDLTAAQTRELVSPFGDFQPQGHAIPSEQFFVELACEAQRTLLLRAEVGAEEPKRGLEPRAYTPLGY
jgi:hypothetical protein